MVAVELEKGIENIVELELTVGRLSESQGTPLPGGWVKSPLGYLVHSTSRIPVKVEGFTIVDPDYEKYRDSIEHLNAVMLPLGVGYAVLTEGQKIKASIDFSGTMSIAFPDRWEPHLASMEVLYKREMD